MMVLTDSLENIPSSAGVMEITDFICPCHIADQLGVALCHIVM